MINGLFAASISSRFLTSLGKNQILPLSVEIRVNPIVLSLGYPGNKGRPGLGVGGSGGIFAVSSGPVRL